MSPCEYIRSVIKLSAIMLSVSMVTVVMLKNIMPTHFMCHYGQSRYVKMQLYLLSLCSCHFDE
jgi:hypothetical protein